MSSTLHIPILYNILYHCYTSAALQVNRKSLLQEAKSNVHHIRIINQ